MSTSWKTIRVFISSTFRDMQAERDHLVRFVFPRLREHLLSYKIHLIAVDLRWGITSEQNILEVCREIVDECRPRFISMLGGRYGWIPPGNDRSITAEEIHYGVLDRNLQDRGYAYFYFRDEASTAVMVEITPGDFREFQDSIHQKKLCKLKKEIIAAGFKPFTYPAKWDSENQRLVGLKSFGDHVYEDLLASITTDPALKDRFVKNTADQSDEFSEENAYMDTFIQERSDRFILGSRESIMKELVVHATTNDRNNYICLTGSPGTGKSTLLAYLSRYLSLNPQPNTLVISHFVGASPGSSDMRRSLRRLCYELKVRCPDITTEIPNEFEKLKESFTNFLRKACKQHKVVILLDAINQFDQALHPTTIDWLSEELPGNARIILSAVESSILDDLRQRIHKLREINLKLLEEEDREAIIDQFCQRFRKKFEPAQRAALLAKNDAGIPLYLVTALEEIRTLGIYEEITQRILEMPSTTQELFVWILRRLENDDGFQDAIGQKVGSELVSHFATLLSTSRHGLSESELSELLTLEIVKTDSSIVAAISGNLAALLNLLQPYLMNRGELIDFYHDQFRKAIEVYYLQTNNRRLSTHQTLASYFHGITQQDQERQGNGKYLHALSDLPYHQLHGHLWTKCAETLADYDFVERKVRAGMAYDILRDYNEANKAIPNDCLDKQQDTRLRHWNNFTSYFTQRLADGAEPFIQLAYNSAADSSVANAAELRMIDSKELWLRLLQRPKLIERPVYIRNIEAQRGIRTLAVTPDGRYVVSAGRDRTTAEICVWDIITGQRWRKFETGISDIKAMVIFKDGRCAVVPENTSGLENIDLYDMATGIKLAQYSARTRWIDQLVAMYYRSGNHLALQINALALTPDNKLLIAATNLFHVALFDTFTGKCIRRFGVDESEDALPLPYNGHSSSVDALALTIDGTKLLTGGEDDTIKVWNIATGDCIQTIETSSGGVKSLAIMPEGDRVVSVGRDSSIKIWDISSGNCTGVINHNAKLLTLASDADGIKIVTTDDNDDWGVIRVWDPVSLENRKILSSHTDKITAIESLSGSGRVVIAGSDRTLQFLDLSGVFEEALNAGHGDPVTNIVVTSDGRRAISGAGYFDRSGQVQIWDMKTGRCLHTLSDYRGRINSIVVTQNGSNAFIGSEDGSLWNLDIEVGTSRLIPTKLDCIKALALTRDERFVIISGFHRNGPNDNGPAETSILNIKTGAHGMSFERHGHWVSSLAVTPDNLRVIGGGAMVCAIWELKTGSILHKMDGLWNSLDTVTISSDGHYLATGGYQQRNVVIWDLRAREFNQPEIEPQNGWWSSTLHANFEEHLAGLADIKFTPNSQWVVTACNDKTLRIFDLTSKKRVVCLRLEAEVTACAVSPDGQHIIAGDSKGQVYFFALENPVHKM